MYFILNSWFLTTLIQIQLVSGTCEAFSCILTVDLDLWMDSLTLNIIFEVENMKCTLMKFTWKVYLMLKSGFLSTLIKCSSFLVHTRHFSLIWPLTFSLKCHNAMLIQFNITRRYEKWLQTKERVMMLITKDNFLKARYHECIFVSSRRL